MKVRLEPSITYGNLLQTAVLIGGLVGAWFNMRAEITSHGDKLKEHSQALRQVQQTDARLSETLQVLTTIVEERTGKSPHTTKN